MVHRLLSVIERRLVLVALLIWGVSLGVLYGARPNYLAINADGIGYYAYLPAVLIEREVTGERVAATIDSVYGPGESVGAGLIPHPLTGRRIDKYPPGAAVLMSPFVVLAHLLAPHLGFAANGFSAPYHAAVHLAALCWWLVGLTALRRVLRERFGVETTGAVLGLLLVGTNLVTYVVYDPGYSHVYSFALLALLVRASGAWWARPSLGRAIVIGVLVGAMVLTRVPNAIACLVPLLWGARDSETVRRTLGSLARRGVEVGAAGIAAAMLVLPQLFLWRLGSGQWVIQPYVGETFHFASPRLWSVLFGLRRGLFVHTPVLLVALGGMWTRAMRRDPALMAVAGVLLLQAYVVASWWNWWYGASWGHRGFVEYQVLMAIPMGHGLGWLGARVSGDSLWGLLGMVVAGNIVASAIYWTKLL